MNSKINKVTANLKFFASCKTFIQGLMAKAIL